MDFHFEHVCFFNTLNVESTQWLQTELLAWYFMFINMQIWCLYPFIYLLKRQITSYKLFCTGLALGPGDWGELGPTWRSAQFKSQPWLLGRHTGHECGCPKSLRDGEGEQGCGMASPHRKVLSPSPLSLARCTHPLAIGGKKWSCPFKCIGMKLNN